MKLCVCMMLMIVVAADSIPDHVMALSKAIDDAHAVKMKCYEAVDRVRIDGYWLAYTKTLDYGEALDRVDRARRKCQEAIGDGDCDQLVSAYNMLKPYKLNL